MKKPNLKFCIALVFVLTLCISPYAKADWDPADDPHKMHFPQLPDEDGWAVNATAPLVLADDWQCSETGWVKDIHFWGAWKNGLQGQIVSFVLSIHDNIPVGPDNPYSRPGATLWEGEIYDFTAVPIDPPTMEGWYDPNTGEWIHPDHRAYFQYNSILPEEDWFWQEKGQIYWLNISAILVDPMETQWGWKSTEDHWMDDAVWALWGELDWKDMFEPNDPDIDDFSIMLDPMGNFVGGGGGSGYVSDPPPSTAPWYFYENTGWWNQWYYDGIFDPNRYKVVHIEFFASQPWPDEASMLEVALNWSTPEWPSEAQPEPVPPLPPLTQDEEDEYIRREVLLSTTNPYGYYTLDYVIRDYNPEWVSIDVMGYNFEITNGVIEHSCVPSLDLAFVITGGENLDFGDANDPTYPTLLASDGARHVIGGPWMDDGTGTDGPDAEPDGQPHTVAMGDDLDGNDDEDGLTIPTLTPGVPVTFPLIVSDPAGAGGFVEIWIDYNIDGDWDDAGELAHSAFLGVGLNNVTITAPTTAVPGMTFARGRICSNAAGTGSPRGQASDGEVEDTEVYIEPPDLDFGDAPDPTYPTFLASDGARHIIAGPWMGDGTDAPDAEPDGQPVPPAAGDDLDGNDDEDGLILPTLTAGQAITFPLQVNDTIGIGAGGVVEIWIDYNIDGDWDDAGELAYSNFLAVGNHLITINVPAAVVPGMSFARGRISRIGTGSPRGQAPNGEVEDTEVYIELPPEKPEVKHLKWSQPPIENDPCNDIPEYCGWNEESWTQNPDDPIPMHSVIDDFRCIGSMPVASIHFWGSYIDWDSYNPPLIRPTEWEFKFYANTPAPDDPDIDPNYSHPSKLLWKVIVPDDRVFTEWKGYDYYPNMPFESCFQHYVDLEPEEYFWQNEHLEDTNDNVFWLGIRAIYPDDVDIAYPWGWKTRPESWMDDAVKYEGRIVGWEIDPDTGGLIPIVVYRYWPIEEPIFGLSFDAAFELDTDPNYIKWEQPFTGLRHWPHYEDKLSMATVEQWIEQITKWRQKPDITDYNGIDVDATEDIWLPQILADDFLCEEDGPIQRIHVWGSWHHDLMPYDDPCAVTFTLSIHEDLPIDDPCNPNLYSMPGRVLWMRDFQPGEFEVIRYDEIMEGWYIPCSKPPYYDLYADNFCWLYMFPINPDEAFFQEVGNIYWLDVQAKPLFWPECPEPIRFGWKNTNPYNHFMDDAVYAVGQEPVPVPGPWKPLVYPNGHNWAGQTVDLAFEIITDITKWCQPPEFSDFNSIDIDATKDIWLPQVLADDFNCISTEPITDIHIWGSWWHDLLPFGDPNMVEFTLSIYSNDPCGPNGYSQPAELLWSHEFKQSEFEVSIYEDGLEEGYYVPCSEPEPHYEPFGDSICFQYDFYIDESEAFVQEGDPCNPVIYWLAVQARPAVIAGIPMPPERPRFGWKTRDPHDGHFMDDAVWSKDNGQSWNELRYPLWHPYEGESIDLAFEITSEIVHEEELSIEKLAADDWFCERRTPVTAIVWFGSYLGYIYETPCTGTLQPRPVPPDYFLIAIYEDVPADDPNNEYDFSHPGRKLWEYAAYDYDEVLVGYDKHPEDVAGPHEPVYRYSVRLPEDKWFRQREVGGIYWISIMAVYVEGVELNHEGWGWTIHEYVFGDDAVQGGWLAAAPDQWEWKEILDQNKESADLSFILFTDPNDCDDCADYNWDDIVNFYDYAIFALDWRWTGPAGGYANGDLDCNGKVDFEDLETFCLQWLDSCL